MRSSEALKYIIFCLLLFAINFLGFFSCIAQNLSFDHLKIEDGLSNNSVLSLEQDDFGFIWIGTANGLNRYDGKRFKVYKTNAKDSSSISNNNILSLATDNKGNLWVGTTSGLNKYNPQTDQFQRIGIDGINSIYFSSSGAVWVGAVDGLYAFLNPKSDKLLSFSREQGLAGDEIRAIYEDHLHNLWVGTDKGLSMIEMQGNQFRVVNFDQQLADGNSLKSNYITSIAEDDDHNLWIGTQNSGLYLYVVKEDRFFHYEQGRDPADGLVNNKIRKILKDRITGMLWVGTQEGISIINPRSRKFQTYRHVPDNKESLSQNSVYSILQDANGSIWIGTYFGGLNTAYTYQTPFEILQDGEGNSSINNNVVSGILEDEKKNLWIGTEGGGANYFDRTKRIFKAYKNDPANSKSIASNLVKCIYRDKDGNTWIGTHGGGLNLFEPSTGSFKHYLYNENDPLRLLTSYNALFEDRLGRFWVGSSRGIMLFKRNGTSLEKWPEQESLQGLKSLYAQIIFEDSKNRIWIGTRPGLYVLTGNLLEQKSLNELINCITEDLDHNIWIGTMDGGLYCYNNSNGQLKHYTKKDGLPDNSIFGILQDDKNVLWLSTNNGIVKFDPQKNIFQTYTTSDGLAGNEFNLNSYFKDSNGKFYFGGFNGITSFYPSEISFNEFKSPVVLTGLKLINKEIKVNDKSHLLKKDINLTDKIVLNHNQNIFTVEYALLNYVKSEKNKYAYKLSGFDDNWIETPMASITYTDLSSGTYQLMIKGANNDGVWSDVRQLTIKILPPFWLTWWAYCIYAASVFFIIFFVTRFIYLRALLRKESELHQVKLDFFTNISHEIRTHLTLIMAPVEKMLENSKGDEFFSQQLNNINSNARRLLKLVSELMDFRKAETNNLLLHVSQQNIIPFLQDIYEGFRELSLSKNITASFIHNTDEVMLYFDKEQLEKVFFNLLSNAFKFTPEGGRIILNVEEDDKYVKISISDNGQGIEPQYLEKIFTNFFQVADHGLQNTGYGIGLALAKNIVELHKGAITVESAYQGDQMEGHTTFVVRLLKGIHHLEGDNNVIIENKVLSQQPALEKPVSVKKIRRTSTQIPAESKQTILIVEDTDELRELIRENFQDHYTILETRDGVDALAVATEQIPDLIISDVMMPRMDGFTLCNHLKTDERTSHIPVVLLTAKSTQADLLSGLETGADVYLTKPFSLQALFLNARNLLASKEKLRIKFSQKINASPLPGITAMQETVMEDGLSTIDQDFLIKATDLIEEYMDHAEFNVEMMARKFAMSRPVLYKKVKSLTGMSVNDFIKSLRLKKAGVLLLQRKLNVNEICYTVGYNDIKHFRNEFKKQYGKTPTEFAAQGQVQNES